MSKLTSKTERCKSKFYQFKCQLPLGHSGSHYNAEKHKLDHGTWTDMMENKEDIGSIHDGEWINKD